MIDLLSAQGTAALGAMARRRALLAFDFDGTLAPIVADPDRAAVPADWHGRLRSLAQRTPVAIVTGRDADDVRPRLGFSPAAIVGNHGIDLWQPAEGQQGHWPAMAADWLAASQHTLRGHGIAVEVKARSVALHYRHAACASAALAAIDDWVVQAPVPLRSFGGKFVVNLVHRDAPDKAAAVKTLLARFDCTGGLFIGDDENDEPVFAAGIAGLVTARVGAAPESRAGYGLANQASVGLLLDELLRLIAASPGHSGRGR